MSTVEPRQGSLSLTQQAYMEVIGDMERRHGHAHVTELARELGVSKPSVVQMLRRLADSGVVKAGREITLSETGKRTVRELGSRQALLEDFMVRDLGMDPKAAAKEACRMEHIVSAAFLRGLRAFKKRLDDRGA